MSEVDNTTARIIAEQVIELLNLKKNKAGRYETAWGDKSIFGLGRVINRIVEEAK